MIGISKHLAYSLYFTDRMPALDQKQNRDEKYVFPHRTQYRLFNGKLEGGCWHLSYYTVPWCCMLLCKTHYCGMRCFHTEGGTLSGSAVTIHVFSLGVNLCKIFTIMIYVPIPLLYTCVYHECGGQRTSLLNLSLPYTHPWVLK